MLYEHIDASNRCSADNSAASGSPGEVVFKSQGACDRVGEVDLHRRAIIAMWNNFFLSLLLLLLFYIFIYLLLLNFFCSLSLSLSPDTSTSAGGTNYMSAVARQSRCFFSRARSFWSGAPGRTTHTWLLDRLGLASCVRITHRQVTNVAAAADLYTIGCSIRVYIYTEYVS